MEDETQDGDEIHERNETHEEDETHEEEVTREEVTREDDGSPTPSEHDIYDKNEEIESENEQDSAQTSNAQVVDGGENCTMLAPDPYSDVESDFDDPESFLSEQGLENAESNEMVVPPFQDSDMDSDMHSDVGTNGDDSDVEIQDICGDLPLQESGEPNMNDDEMPDAILENPVLLIPPPDREQDANETHHGLIMQESEGQEIENANIMAMDDDEIMAILTDFTATLTGET